MKLGESFMKINRLQLRVNKIADSLRNPSDLQVRCLLDGIYILHIDGIVDRNLCEETIIKPLVTLVPNKVSLENILSLVTALNISLSENDDDIPKLLLHGSVILLIKNSSQFLDIKMDKFAHRNIQASKMEFTTRGPRDSFVEDLAINRSLIRKRLKTEKLKIISLVIGDFSNVSLEIHYIEGIADQNLTKRIVNQIKTINLRYITDSSFIERKLDKRKLKIVPIVQHTERPDTLAYNLMNGKIAILVDGSPDALLLPATFWDFMESPDEYYEIPVFSAFVKLFRLLAFIVSIALPSIYVAVCTFHWGIIPTQLLISFALSRSGIPYPVIVEVLLLEVIFEFLRESGLRFPQNVGQVVSIVGALVIGEAAIQAGFVSAPTIIVVAFTGIASYMIPKYSFGSATRLLRFPLLVVASIAGLPGLILSLTVVLAYFINTDSFGVQFMSPVSTVNLRSTQQWIGSSGFGDDD